MILNQEIKMFYNNINMYKNVKDFKKFYKEEDEKEDNIECENIDNLKVLKIQDPKRNLFKKCNPILPQPPACVIICSPVKTGKSTLLSNILLNPKFYGKDYFDEVIIVSNTIDNDITSRFIKKTFTCHNLYSDKIIYNLIEKQENDKKKEEDEEDKKDPRNSVALIFDDILGSIKRESIANYIATRFRHYNIQLLIYSTQVYRGVSSIVRQNCTDFIMGSPFPNQKEKEKIFEEYGDLYGGSKNLAKIYKLATPERYNFMYLDMQENPPLAYKNFDKLIAKGEKILSNDIPLSDDEMDLCSDTDSDFSSDD